jgi:hypothetical protein
MTKKQLEKLGWKFYSEFNNVMSFEKGDVCKDNGEGAFLNWDTKNDNIKILTTDKGYNQYGPNFSIKFNGYCDTIQMFKIICGIINLKI